MAYRISEHRHNLLLLVEVAARLDTSESTIYRRCRSGQIKVVKIGMHIYVHEDDCPPSMAVLPSSPFTVPEEAYGH